LTRKYPDIAKIEDIKGAMPALKSPEEIFRTLKQNFSFAMQGFKFRWSQPLQQNLTPPRDSCVLGSSSAKIMRLSVGLVSITVFL
jgi:hypothetical protein